MFSSRSPGHASCSSGKLMGCSAAQDREFCWIHRGGIQYYETGSSSGQFVLFVDPNLEVVHSFGRTASGPAFFCARVYEPSNQRQGHPSRRELCFWWSWYSWLHRLCLRKQRYYCLLVLLPLEYRKFTKVESPWVSSFQCIVRILELGIFALDGVMDCLFSKLISQVSGVFSFPTWVLCLVSSLSQVSDGEVSLWLGVDPSYPNVAAD